MRILTGICFAIMTLVVWAPATATTHESDRIPPVNTVELDLNANPGQLNAPAGGSTHFPSLTRSLRASRNDDRDASPARANVTEIHRWPYGLSTGFARNGSLGYLGNGLAFQVLDLTDPAAPQTLGEVLLSDLVGDIVVQGSLAYVANLTRGLQVIDVSDPTEPAVIGGLDTESTIFLDVQANLVYMADAAGLVIIDVAVPTTPTPVNTLALSAAFQIKVRDDHAYVLAADGLHVIDVSNPGSLVDGPVIPFLVNDPDGPTRVALELVGDTAYVVDLMGLHVVDIGDPSAPQVAGFTPTPGGGADLWAMGIRSGLAFYTSSTQLLVVDVNTPSAPELVASHDLNGFFHLAVAIVFDGDRAYLSDLAHGLRILDTSTPLSGITEESFHATGGHAELVDWQGDIAVISGIADLRIYDMTLPSQPELLATLPLRDADLNRVTLAGDLVYLLTDHECSIVDIADPRAPYLRTRMILPFGAADMVMVGDQLGLLFSSSLCWLDVSDPDYPIAIGCVDTWFWYQRVLVQGSYYHLTGGVLYTVADDGNPQIATLDVPDGETDGFVVGTDLACVGKESGVLLFYDISNPENPVEVTTYGVREELEGLALNGSWLYAIDKVDDGDSRLYMLNVTDPANPDLQGSFDSLWQAEELVEQDGQILVTEGAVGFRVLKNDLVGPTAAPMVGQSRLDPCWPNPFNPSTTISWTLAKSQHAKLEVFDSRGRLVATLFDEHRPAGPGSVGWDGTDVSGNRVASGVYLYRLSSDDFEDTKRMVMVR